MSYWALNAIFLALVAVVAIVALAARRAPRWLAVFVSLGVLLVFTAVFDNLLVGLGFVGYNRTLISGIFVGVAPLEDFAYPLAAAILLPSVWALLPRKTTDA